VCRDAAETYLLSRQEADAARLTVADRQYLWGRQVLNPAIFQGG
jgi:hypothetical protein